MTDEPDAAFGQPRVVLDTHQKALAINLDLTSFGSFAEIGAGQEVARWFLRVGAASGTVAKTISAYDKVVSDQMYGSSTRYVSKARLETMLDCEWKSLIGQVGDAKGSGSRLFVFADSISARNFSGSNDCHGWMGVRFQERPHSEASEILIHVNLRDAANSLQQEAVGILGVNLLYAVLNDRTVPSVLPLRLLENLENQRVEIDQIVLNGDAFANCNMMALHMMLASVGAAEAITFDADGMAVAANEYLYKKSVAIIAAASDADDDLAGHAIQAGIDTLWRLRGEASVTDIRTLRLIHVDRQLQPISVFATGSKLVTRHSTLFRAAAFVRRYTNAPIFFLMPLTSVMQIFDSARYQHLEGRLLDSVARLFGERVRVLAYPLSQIRLHSFMQREQLSRWEVSGDGSMITADQIRPEAPLRHLYDYLLASELLVPVAPEQASPICEPFEDSTLGAETEICAK